MALDFAVHWSDNTEEFRRNLALGVTQLDITQKRVDQFVKSLSGESQIKAANNWAAALQKLGEEGGALAGIQKLTADEVTKATAAIDKAVTKYQALGTEAPKALRDISAALHQASSDSSEFQKLLDSFKPSTENAAAGFSSLSKTLGDMWKDPIAGATQFASAMGKDVSASAAAAGGSLATVAVVGAGVAASLLAAGTAAFTLAKHAAAVGAELDDLSEKTGISVPALSKLSNAVKVAGGDITTLTNAVFMMQKNMAENPDKFEKGLERLGLRAEEFKKLAPEEQLMSIATALKETEDPVERNAAGFELMGRQFRDLAPTLYKLNQGLELTKDLNPWTEDEARLAEEFQMHLASIALHFENIGLTLGRAVLPGVESFVTKLDDIAHWTPGHWMQLLLTGGSLAGLAGQGSTTSPVAALTAEELASGVPSNLPQMPLRRGGAPSVMALPQLDVPTLENDSRIVGTTYQEMFKILDDLERENARKAEEAHKKYVEDWQRTDDEVQKIWGEAFASQANFDKDSLASQVAVLEQRRINDINAAVAHVAETTHSAEQADALTFAINAKYHALENVARLEDDKKRLADEQKAQDLSLDLEQTMTKQVGELRKKQNEADAKDKAHWLQVTNDAVKANLTDQIGFERQTEDVLAGMYLNATQQKLRSLDEWLADEQAKLRARQVYSQKAEDDLVALYRVKTQAIIATQDPLFKAWQNLNADMRTEWATTWENGLTSFANFGHAFEQTIVQSMWDPFKKILAGMLADFESILLNPLLNALKRLETAFVNWAVGVGLSLSGAGSAEGGLASQLVGSAVGVGGRSGLGLLGGAAAATTLPAVAGGGVATTSATIPASLAAPTTPFLASAGAVAGGGIGAWLLGQYLGSKTESKPTGAILGGAAGAGAGAAAGAILAPATLGISIGIGAIAGAIAGWRAAGKLYDQVKQQQADLMTQLGGMDGEIKNVGDAYALTGKTGIEAQAALHAMWDAKTPADFAKAVKPVAEALKVLQQNTEDLKAATTDATGRISEAWQRVIDLNKQYGANVKETQAFQKQQADVVMAGFTAVEGAQQDAITGYDDIKKAVDDAQASVDDLMKSGTTGSPLEAALANLASAKTNQAAAGARNAPELADLGSQAVGAFTLSVGTGHSRAEALAAESAALTSLEKEYKDLGIAVDDVGLSELFRQNDILKATGTLMAGLDGVTKQMIGLDNINLETKDNFAAQQRTAEAMYTRIQAAVDATAKANGDLGDQTKEALLPMQDYLHQAEIEAKKLNVPLDALTQQMIDQSKDAGIWQDSITPAPTIQDAIQTLADTVDDLARALRGLPPNVHTHVTVDTTTTTTTTTTTEPAATPNPGPPEAPFARGGIVPRYLAAGWTPKGTDTIPAMLTPGESVLTKAATAYVGASRIAMLNSGLTGSDSSWPASVPIDTGGWPRAVLSGHAREVGSSGVSDAMGAISDALQQIASRSGSGDLHVAVMLDGTVAAKTVVQNIRRNTKGVGSEMRAALGQPVTTW